MSTSVRLRITGTQEECAVAVGALSAGFAVREVSSFYLGRGSSVLGRVYVDAVPLTGARAAGQGQVEAGPKNVHQRIGNVEAGATVIGAVIGDRRPRRVRDADGPSGGVS